MPPHQDVELVTGSYGTRCDAELARGVLHFHPWPAYVSGQLAGFARAHSYAV